MTRLTLKSLALVLAVASPATAQDTVSLTGAEARDLATRAVLAGDPAVGREIARAMVAGDPADGQAWLILAAAEMGLQNAPQALAAARRAHALLSGSARHEAARIAARSEAAMGRFNLAQMWLRRALPDAPTEDAARATVAEAREAAARATWRFSVSGGVLPSDNVNGGSKAADLSIDGFVLTGFGNSIDAQALSGWVANLRFTAEMRLAESETQRTALHFGVGSRRVWLSQESRDRIAADPPDRGEPVTNQSFSSAYSEIGITHDRRLGPGLFGADATVIVRDYYTRQTPFPGIENDDTLSFRLGLSYSAPLGDRATWSSRFSIENITREDGDPRVLQSDLSGRVRVADVGPGSLTLGLSVGRAESDNANRTYNSRDLTIRYDFNEAFGPVKLGVELAAGQTHYPDYSLLFAIPGGRTDDRLSASIEASFPSVSYAGFSPVVSLDAGTTDSNVSRFDSDNMGLGLQFRSTF